MKDFRSWWKDNGPKDCDDPTYELCYRAWMGGRSAENLRTADAYNRGRFHMLLCWLIGLAGAVAWYFLRLYP